MIKIRLNQDQREALKALRNTRSFLGERAHYMLLSDEGCSVKDIAQRLNRHEHTVRSWIKSYIASGIEGLQNKHPPGRPKIKGPAVEQEIDIILINTPREFGYQEEGWTVCILLDYFSKKQLNVKEDTVRRALKKRGWVYKRFAKRVPKNAPSKEEKSQKIEQLVATIQQDNPDETLFVDEANFMTGPYVQRGWFKKGEKKNLLPNKKKTQTIFGALRFNGRLYWKKADRGTGDSFIWFMRQLLQNNPTKKIALILDNASQHACKKVRQFLQRYPQIKLYFLPPYSPEYNPIERFWGWLKKHLYGSKSYERMEDVIKQMRQLIWHYQENKVTSKIQFNFGPYQKLINV